MPDHLAASVISSAELNPQCTSVFCVREVCVGLVIRTVQAFLRVPPRGVILLCCTDSQCRPGNRGAAGHYSVTTFLKERAKVKGDGGWIGPPSSNSKGPKTACTLRTVPAPHNQPHREEFIKLRHSCNSTIETINGPSPSTNSVPAQMSMRPPVHLHRHICVELDVCVCS